MTVPASLLGLLEREPSHGYDLKRDYDHLFGRGKPLPYGQVYATLSRLARDGKVIAREHTFLVGVEGVSEGEVLTQFLVRYYLPNTWRARLAVLPAEPADEAALREAFGDAQFLYVRTDTLHAHLAMAAPVR